jgi:hypothetical protein
LAANCRAFALVAAGWFPRGLFERERRSSSSSSRLSRSNTRFSRACRSSITFRLSPTWDRCWRARSTPLRSMQITGRIMIPVVIIAAFPTTPMADAGHNSLRAGYAVSNSDTSDIFAARELQACTFHRSLMDRASVAALCCCAAAHRGRSQPNRHRAQRVRSLQAVHLRADDPKSIREEQRCRSGGTSVQAR